MNLTQISIKRPTIIVVIFSALIVLGLYSYTTLNYELLPDINPPNISITTVYPGASPSEVENSVTKKIEDNIALTENVNQINSKSLEGISIVQVEMQQSADIDESLENVQRKINQMLSELPEDCKTPTVNKFNIDDLPIIKLGLFSDLSGTDFYDLVERTIQPEMSQITGVAEVEIVGGTEREIQIRLNTTQLEKYKLVPSKIVEAVANANMEFPTGKIKAEKNQTNIRLSGKISSLQILENLVVKKEKDGTTIKLSDIAEVADTHKETKLINRTNGVNSIGLDITKQSDANSVEVSKLVREKLIELKRKYADKNFNYKIANDTSVFTLEAADAVMFDLMLAIILVAAVMLLFLHTIRNSLIVMVSIPTSIISTFIVMSLLGYTLNMMTLLALSLVIGILVDDSIVVLENIHRHLEMGKDKVQASYTGRMEIGFTALSITLVDIVVFFPIALASGVVADLLQQYSIVIITSTMMSLFVSFTLVPYISSRFARLENLSKKSFTGKIIYPFENVLNKIIDEVIVLLKWSLKNKTIVLAVSILMLIGSVMLIPAGLIGSQFVDAGDRGEFVLHLEAPKKSRLEQLNLVTREVEQFIAKYPQVESFFTTVGKSSGGLTGGSTANYKAEINVKLVSKSERNISTDFFSREVKLALEEKFQGIKFKAKPISLLGMVNSPVQLVITGPDFQANLDYSKKLKQIVEDVKGTVEVESSVDDGNPEYKIDINRDLLKKLGLSISKVGSNLQIAFNGNDKNKFRDNDKEYDITIKLDEFDRNSKEDISNTLFLNDKKELIKLSQFADVVEASGPTQLERTNRMSSLKIQSGIIGRTTGEVISDIKKQLEITGIPKGIAIEFKGEAERQSDAFGTLGFALILSIFLVYLVMVALYDSYLYPFVVLFSIPLAIIGALLMLALMRQSLSVFSIVGVIMLIGLVAKNAILVVDFTNYLKKRGKETGEALLEAVRLRFRPILMTNISMIIGLLPLALASGAGSEWKNGLAWALIGGLTSSMVLSMIIVPVIYYTFDNAKAKLGFGEKKEIILTTE